MKFWKKDTGVEFKNSNKCFGREYKSTTGKIDIATISIRGKFPENGWGYLEESHEMAFILNGEGLIETKSGQIKKLETGDVVYVEPKERFRWEGNFDMVVTCGPAFDPDKHHLEEK